jgi:predicted peroxiredoxin
MSNDNNVVVVLTTGKHDRGTRATLAFAWACTALAMGKPVSLYLTMDGTLWAMHGTMKGLQVEGFEPLSQYLEQFLLLGGELMVCAPCSEYYCSFDPAKISSNLIPEAKLVGLTTIVSKIGPGSSVVSF